MSKLCLTPEELADLTKSDDFLLQKAWLRKNRLPFDVSRIGAPKTMRSNIGDDVLSAIHENIKMNDENFLSLCSMDSDDLLSIKSVAQVYSGVYFLFFNNEIVYIGQSKNILNRLGNHAASKEFDSYSIIKVEPKLLNKIERFYINKFKPALNVAGLNPIQSCE